MNGKKLTDCRNRCQTCMNLIFKNILRLNPLTFVKHLCDPWVSEIKEYKILQLNVRYGRNAEHNTEDLPYTCPSITSHLFVEFFIILINIHVEAFFNSVYLQTIYSLWFLMPRKAWERKTAIHWFHGFW